MKEKTNLYLVIYQGIKTVLLIIITSVVFLFSFALSFTMITLIFSNFIDHDYEYGFHLLDGLNLKNFSLLIGLNILIFLVFYIYRLDKLLYHGIFLYIMQGLSLFIILEIIMVNFYLPTILVTGLTTRQAVKQALLFTNYKIALSLLLIILIGISLFILLIFVDWYMLLFLTLPIYFTQVLAKWLLKSIDKQ